MHSMGAFVLHLLSVRTPPRGLAGRRQLVACLSTAPSEVLLIRHGRTYMNEHLSAHPWGAPGFADARLFDTRLTATGLDQAAELREELLGARAALLERVAVVYASPLSRALETAALALPPDELLPGVARRALPEACERLYLSSDVGRASDELCEGTLSRRR